MKTSPAPANRCRRLSLARYVWSATLLALLASLEGTPADRLAMLASSALSNCGLSHEPVVATGAGCWTLVATMLVGRAAPLALIWWIATTTRDVDVV